MGSRLFKSLVFLSISLLRKDREEWHKRRQNHFRTKSIIEVVLKQLHNRKINHMFFDNKIFAVLFIILFCQMNLNHLLGQSSQLSPFEEASDLAQMEAKVYLLRNSNQQIPLKRLDTLTFASAAIGLVPNNTFQKTLQQYAPVSILTPSQVQPLITGQSAQGKESSNHQLIIGLDLNQQSDWPQGLDLKQYCARAQSILVVFGK